MAGTALLGEGRSLCSSCAASPVIVCIRSGTGQQHGPPKRNSGGLLLPHISLQAPAACSPQANYSKCGRCNNGSLSLTLGVSGCLLLLLAAPRRLETVGAAELVVPIGINGTSPTPGCVAAFPSLAAQEQRGQGDVQLAGRLPQVSTLPNQSQGGLIMLTQPRRLWHRRRRLRQGGRLLVIIEAAQANNTTVHPDR